MSDDRVYTVIEGKPGPTYVAALALAGYVTMYDVDTARNQFGYDTGGALVWPESFTLEPAPIEIRPFMRRDRWKSVHSSKN